MKKEKKQTENSVLKKLTSIENLLQKKDDKPLSFKEACAYLGFAPSYLYKLTYKKIIPHYKPTGKMLFFSKCELDEWIFKKSGERKTKPATADKSDELMENEEEEDSETDASAKIIEKG